MKLSNFTHGRDNNFNLIRIVAAFAVLITHSFALAIGPGTPDPFSERLGITMGEIGVDIFFITSGLLVTASLLTRQNVIQFVWARILRIFPALLLMLLLTVFGLGVFFTSLPLSFYLTDSKIYFYLLKGATLINGVPFDLPGVFDCNPCKNAVNGSLWTMPYEIKMYAILAVGWVVLRVIKKSRLRLFRIAILTSCVVPGVLLVARQFYLPTEDLRFSEITKWYDIFFFIYKSEYCRLFAKLSFMFLSGASFYVLKEHITLSRSFFWLFVIVLLSATIINKHVFHVLYLLTITYILVYMAYIPSGFIRKYNQLGDYSYGIYIYAFPVQQSVAALIPGISVLSMLSISAFATLLLAALSWHLLERRALGLKRLYVGHTSRILSSGITGSLTLMR
jgi:peptidoglycan/LPS O-acetylase OafA/YrhL